MRVLAGDIGGTKTRLGLVEAHGGALALGAEATYPSGDFPGLEAIIERFLAAPGHDARLDAACFGVAGPVRDGRCQTTNLPWVIDAAALRRRFDWPAAFLLNDLEALAWALETLPESSLLTLSPGQPDPHGNAALLAAGTGLGEAGLARDAAGRLRPFATEGGHASFAPRNELEIALLRHLLAEHHHVSWERVVSGPGLVVLHDFLRQYREVPVPAWLAAEMAAGDAAAAISAAALDGRCELCREALDLFLGLYGAEAGNLALKTLATGGVFIGGSIAAKLRARFAAGDFLAAFTAKGRMRPLLAAMPVKLVLDDRAALLGAARFAALEASGGPPAP